VKQLTILITPEGQWVLPDTPEFYTALGDPNPDYDAIGFAVKNLGFIKLQVIEQSIIEVELHPCHVELAALLAVQQQLLRSEVKLFRIRYLDTEWKSEITSSAEKAITRLSELSTPAHAPPPQGKYLVEPQDLSALMHDDENPLRRLVQKWRTSFGHFDPNLIPFMIQHQLLSRLVIVGIKPRVDDPIFRFIGDGHSTWLDPKHQVSAIGEKIVNLPDKDYGGWAAEFYKNVTRTGQPRYDYVTATIQGGTTPYITRYERLLLPWKTRSEEVLVTLWSKGLYDGSERNSGPAESDSWSAKNLARSS
jgi:hypothetical protein